MNELFLALGSGGAVEPGAVVETVKLLSTAGLMALMTLTLLEVVLGIDNVVFLTILTGRLPEEKRGRANTIGLVLAGLLRLVMLGGAYWIMKMDEPFTTFTVLGSEIALSGQSVILLVGGLFLIAKATWEIHHMLEGEHEETPKPGGVVKAVSESAVLMQVTMLNVVFSIDSVVTAVGMTSNYWIMAIAVIVSVLVMIFFAGAIGRFVNAHPTMKTLALAFLVLIGVLLVADGLGQHLNRGYVYFAMAFALGVELVNMMAGHRRKVKNS